MDAKLFFDNTKLIHYVIKRIGIMYDLQECYDVGELALLKAIQTYDESKGCKFSSYATNCIQYDIFNYLAYKSNPRRKNDFLNMSIDECLEDKGLLIEIIDSGIDLEKDIMEKEKIDLLNTIIEILEPNDSYMVKHYFGLGNNEKMTQKEIADELGLKQNYVSFRIKRALKIIKKIMQDRI